MKIREKIFGRVLLLCVLAVAGNGDAMAQLDLKNDTLECPIIGFSVGMMAPSNALSKATAANGSTVEGLRMSDLYSAPWMNVGLDVIYKFKSNWLLMGEGNMWFAGNNLKNRTVRMGSVYTSEGLIIGSGGMDATATCSNRGFSIEAGGGRVFALVPEKNPNSGILAMLRAGYLRQQTIFMLNQDHAPQLENDMALLYDHQRHGFTLTEGVGFWYMNNKRTLMNLYVGLEVKQCWTWSTRDYVIDYSAGLQGKDRNRYFDWIWSLKLCWMFPLTGKASHDYYFY